MAPGQISCLINALNIEDPVCNWWLLLLKKSDRHIADRDSCQCLAIQLAMMSMTVQNEIGAVPVDHFREAGSAQKSHDFGIFAADSRGNGGIVKDDHTFGGAEL